MFLLEDVMCNCGCSTLYNRYPFKMVLAAKHKPYVLSTQVPISDVEMLYSFERVFLFLLSSRRDTQMENENSLGLSLHFCVLILISVWDVQLVFPTNKKPTDGRHCYVCGILSSGLQFSKKQLYCICLLK